MSERPDAGAEPLRALLEDRRLLWGILLLVGGAYASAAGAGWFWDDARLIIANPVVQQMDVVAAFQHHLWWGVVPDMVEGAAYWRPLVLLSFFLDHVISGDSPGFPHLHNLAWHLLVVALVYVAARPHVGGARAALAALLAGLHPSASGAVLWVAARNDLMCAAALLGTVCAADRRRPVLAGVLAALAGMSKEVGFVAPFFLVTWQLAWGTRGARESVARGPLVAVTIASALTFGMRALATLPVGTFHADAASAALATVYGLAQIPLVWPLAGVVWLPAIAPAPYLLGSLVCVALLAALVWDAPRRGGLLVVLALLAFAPTVGASAASARSGEWYLYLSLVLLAFPVAAAARRWMALPGMVLGVTWLVVLGLRVGEWTDDETLTRATLAREPSSLAWARLGSVLDAQNRVDEALEAYTIGLEMTPTFTRACASPARMLKRAGREEEASAFVARFPCAGGAVGE